jgi:hypothetical protein
MMSSEPQLGQRRKGGMLDISDEDDRHPLFYPPFTKKHYPAIFFSSDVSFLLPVTYDFNVIRLTDYIRLAPYAGLGATFSTGQNNNASLLLTAGVDIPITDQFAATLGVNIAPVDGFSIGFLLGGAYTFGKF